MDIQKELFEKLKPLIPKGKTLAEYIGDILYLSNDSVYRRLRCETQLTITELKAICDHFGLSADTLISLRKENQITCQVGRVGSSPLSFIAFLNGIHRELNSLKQYSDPKIIYSGKDIPLFYNMLFPKLFAFKYYMWMQVFAQSPEFMQKDFDPEIKDPEVLEAAHKVLGLYNSIPTVEIWNAENINSLLIQIEFYKHSKFFGDPGHINRLYDEVDELINHIEKQAEAGCKFLPEENPDIMPGTFSMFVNKVSLSDNIIWLKSGDRRMTYINYTVLNFISTGDYAFCVEVEKYLGNILRRSTQISLENMKMRTIYFNQQRQKVEQYRNNH